MEVLLVLISNAETLSELSEVADRPHLNQALALVPGTNTHATRETEITKGSYKNETCF